MKFTTVGELSDYLLQKIKEHGREYPVVHRGEWAGELYPVTIVDTTINDKPLLFFIEEGEQLDRNIFGNK